ncbi:GroES-like protein [Xylariaceae sp. FL1019]|nr:GroES-like protein [Xylariaceae sp. FL1019]
MTSNSSTTLPEVQQAILQLGGDDTASFPLYVSHDAPLPVLSSARHVLVRVLAVALNHCDYKMATNFPTPGGMAGCDFCGEVVAFGSTAAEEATYKLGARVCGAVFPYGSLLDADDARASGGQQQQSGSFAEYLTIDYDLVLRVPDSWSDLDAAALGAVGWGTVGLAMSDPEALALDGFPSAPMTEGSPVLVYGGATAVGTMACQLLKLSGHIPIAVTSPASSEIATRFGALATAFYTESSCVSEARKHAAETSDGEPIRHALDIITSAESASNCFAALARTGGRYACLEGFSPEWRSRRAVKVKEVMGYEGLGHTVRFGERGAEVVTYARKANPQLATLNRRWLGEMQGLLDDGSVRHHPFRDISMAAERGGWACAVLEGLKLLQRGEVRGTRLVVRVANL